MGLGPSVDLQWFLCRRIDSCMGRIARFLTWDVPACTVIYSHIRDVPACTVIYCHITPHLLVSFIATWRCMHVIVLYCHCQVLEYVR